MIIMPMKNIKKKIKQIMSVHFAFCGLYIDGEEREGDSAGFEQKQPIFG